MGEPESMMLVEIWVLESKMLKHHDAYKKNECNTTVKLETFFYYEQRG